MKKLLVVVLLIIAILAIVMVKNLKNSEVAHDTALTVVVGKFAFCGASGATPTGDTITIEGKQFLEGVAACPVLDGPSVANTILVPNPSITPDSTDKTVWSYFWYYDSVPQAPTWENLPTANRTFTIANTPDSSMSNMWCMPCKILPKKVNGVTIAECFGPLNELAFPMRRALRAHPGQTSVTQAPVGATYSVGTIIPSIKTKK
jgi:hypothetical protein|tara:strand:- start:1040 stop:1651 length:612 start_codon:yes stop_codon:yes gene_type:complete